MTSSDDLTRLMTLALEQVPAGTEPEVVEAMAEAMQHFAAHRTPYDPDPEFPMPELFWLELPGGGAIPDPAGVSCILYNQFPALCIVAQDDVEISSDTVMVSTIFLHINYWHSFGMHGPAALYETMIFSAVLFEEGRESFTGEPVRIRKTYPFQMRYATREAAEEGHAKVREALRAGVSIEALREMEIEP